MQPWVNVGRTFYISKSKWADSNLFAKHHQPLLNVSQWNVPRSLVTWQLSRKGGSVDAGMIAWWWQRWSIIRKHERWLFIDNMQPILQIQTICIITCVAPVVSTVNDPLCVSASYINGDASSMTLVVVVMHILHDLPCTTDSRLKQHNDPRFTRSGPDK